MPLEGEKPKLSRYMLGEKPTIDEEAARRVHEAVGLPLDERFSWEEFYFYLNQISQFAVGHSLNSRANVRKTESLKGYFDKYEALSLSMQRAGFLVPLFERKWFLDTQQWFDDFDNRKKWKHGHGLRNTSFCVRLIGLFVAAFGQRPTPTTSEADARADGKLAKFSIATLEEIKRFVDTQQIDERYSDGDLLRRSWKTPTSQALRKQLEDGLKIKAAKAGDHLIGANYAARTAVPIRPELAWEVHCKFFLRYAKHLGI